MQALRPPIACLAGPQAKLDREMQRPVGSNIARRVCRTPE